MYFMFKFLYCPFYCSKICKTKQLCCGCWDSSPGLHGHNVEFLPLNYNHILVEIAVTNEVFLVLFSSENPTEDPSFYGKTMKYF